MNGFTLRLRSGRADQRVNQSTNQIPRRFGMLTAGGSLAACGDGEAYSVSGEAVALLDAD